MFAPNRLMTTKEQWLLVGFAAAVLVGCITVLVHDNWAAVAEDTPGTIVIPKQTRNAVVAKPSVQEKTT